MVHGGPEPGSLPAWYVLPSRLPNAERMTMVGPRSFRQRIFLALLIVALVPAAGAVLVGAFSLRGVAANAGTFGPWDALAESGSRLIDAATEASPGDSMVAAMAESHRQALSESLRLSRALSFLNERAMALLPGLALLSAGTIALIAFVIARWMARGFSDPIQELVAWTETLGRNAALPAREGPDETGPDEFRVLKNSFRGMAADLETARARELETARLKAWTEMARRVAHEIKNPLTPMQMAATTMALSGDRQQSETAQIFLDEIDRLDEMARMFSQFGRMPEGPRSQIDLVELLETLAARHARSAGDIVVEAPESLPRIFGHFDVLSRAFRNIIVNALEANDAASRGESQPSASPSVTIRVSLTDECLRVLIQDCGPGIPPEILETLWFPDVTTKRRGTGLGLAIVQQALEVHGGSVSARNRSGDSAGAEFEIVIPLNDEAPSSSAPA